MPTDTQIVFRVKLNCRKKFRIVREEIGAIAGQGYPQAGNS